MSTAIHGIRPDYMDLTADPGVDFFRYCNGAWVDRTEIPPEYPRWGAFLILREQALDRVHALLQEVASVPNEPGSNQQKIGDFFFTGMDEEKIERDGARPLAGELSRINAARTLTGLARLAAHLHLRGVNVLFAFESGADFENSSQVIAHATQGGLGLPDRDYYLQQDEKSVALQKKYQAFVTRMFELLGEKPKIARKHARAVLEIETGLAQVSMSKVDLRDPNKISHKMSLSELQELIPRLPLHKYLQALGCPAIETLNVMQPDFFAGLNRLLETTPLRDLKAYMRYHLACSAASCLSSAFVNARFEFYDQALQGSKELQPRWKRVVGMTNGLLGEAVGQLYVARHFPPESKAQMTELVANLRLALAETLAELTWMSEETRRNAVVKLDAFDAMIGYPDKWTDYSTLAIDRESFVGNVLRACEFAARRELDKIGKPVDRLEWHMSPQTVNAYYSPLTNQIVFPAAILQPPFFDPQADDATNYGAIGVVIGHEITHGFDDEGSKFDARGNLKNWWTDTDREGFESRIDLIKSQFSSFTVAGGKHVNGELVSGEAAADLGGVKLAYRALKKALASGGRKSDGEWTDDQRFFISFAQIWASKSTPQYEEFQVTNDPHPPAQFRVNGTLAHVAEFPRAFGLREDCPLMLPEEKRCHLW